MLRQARFSDLEYTNKQRRTRRELFLAEMDAVVPWPELLAVVGPHDPRRGGVGGRGPHPPSGGPAGAVVRRSGWPRCCGSTFFSNGSRCRTARWRTGSPTSRACGVGGFSNVTAALPDETTILNFRHLLEQHDLTTRLLERVNRLLKTKGLLVSQGTMVDATIIHAPSSTKNAKSERDPEMHQTKKGNQWYFGMK